MKTYTITQITEKKTSIIWKGNDKGEGERKLEFFHNVFAAHFQLHEIDGKEKTLLSEFEY